VFQPSDDPQVRFEDGILIVDNGQPAHQPHHAKKPA